MNRFYLAAAIAVAVVVIVPIASRRLETGALESTIAGFLLGLRSQTIESLHRLGSRFDDWVAAVLAYHARQVTINALWRLNDRELKDVGLYRDGIASDHRIFASNREAEVMMTAKVITLRVLGGFVVVVTTGLMLSVAGLPMGWLSCLMDMSLG
jgi:uncharacterized protein YjiS (DUF1127 family)